MGFYPVTPSVPQYVIGSPLFDKVTLSLSNGKQFVISAPDNSDENVYIHSAALNGKAYRKPWLSFTDIRKGGHLEFQMDKRPHQEWGSDPADVPYSMSREK